ncbi:MAG: hypothetical protein K6B40_07025 [Firmicutes bacterium]|nr:hypothetical protein [Bacillota bacterium]
MNEIKTEDLIENSDGLLCCSCQMPLRSAKTHVSYMDSTFSTLLLRCPRCGQPYLDEETALGKVAEVEMILEEK